MLARVLTTAVLLALLAGCTPGAVDVGRGAALDSATPIQVGELTRSYIVHAPQQAGGPQPLLIVLHGAGGDAARAESVTGFTDEAARGGFVVAYPNGTAANLVDGELAWNAGGCCGLARAKNVDDVTFILAMISEIEAAYAIDTSRIYLAGYSNGGMMSYRLACEHSELFAGIAVVSGALNYSPCDPTGSPSVLIIHGTADLTVPYEGGETNERTAGRFGQWTNSSVEYATNFWATANDCEPDAVVTEQQPTTTEIYEGCENDSAVEVVTIAEGTHTWPRLDTLGVDGARLIVSFFALD